MWDPGFHFAEVRLADIEGFQRRFTYKITIGRGTPEHPALMVALEQRPGRCRGLAFRIAADMVDAESEILWRREMLRGG
jgi:cation transport protein ChaC